MALTRAVPRGQQPERPPASLVEWVADLIIERIGDGRYAEGQPLREQDLAAELGVSRSPIREAFRILERDGLLRRSPRRGVVVAAFSEKAISDIYDCRIVLSSLSVRNDAATLTDADLAYLKELVRQMEATLSPDDLPEHFRLHVEFHEFLDERSGNEALQELIKILGRRIHRPRLLALSLPSRAEESLALHRALIRALESHDADEAVRIKTEMLDRARCALIEHLQATRRPAQPEVVVGASGE